MPRTWRAGGIGPTTAKQNAGAGGVEVWSLERYELEKQKELLVILMKKLERYELEKQKKLLIILLKSGRSRVCVSSRSRRSRRFSRTGRLQQEPEVLKKLEKFFVKVLK